VALADSQSADLHEPLVSRELFEMAEQRAERKGRAMKVGMPRQGHKQVKRQAQRLCPFVGRVRCALCGHSMEGSHQRGPNWYRCQYVRRRSDAAATHADHPKVLGDQGGKAA
jgi:recombinase-like zinc beta ribbon protein